jgi:hypothetical protein
MTLTPGEKKAIAALKRVAKIWPKSLWVFCNGTMSVLKKRGGKRVMDKNLGGAVDQSCIVADVDIENDGGDY